MKLARDIATVGSGTLTSRLLAYVRDAGIASVLGAGAFSEAFFVVSQVVNFFRRLLAEGALNGAFVPIWLRLRGSEDGGGNADRMTRRSLAAMFCITGMIAMLAVVFAHAIIAVIAPGFDDLRRQLAILYLFLVAPYIVAAGLVAVIAAALNAEGRVGAVTISTIVFNLVMVLAVASVLGDTEQFLTSVWLSTAVGVAGIVQLVVTAAAWLLTGKRWGRARAYAPGQVRLFFGRAVPGLIAAGIPQLKLIGAAAIVSSSSAAVSWLYYANRLYELPLGVASVAIAAVLGPRIAESVRLGDPASTGAAQSRAFETAVGLALPSAVAFAVLAEPIAGGLFERGAFGAGDTAAVAAALAAMAAGLPGHALEKVFGAISFAHEDTRTPMLAALCGLAIAIVGALLLFPRYGHVGAAAAIAISGWVGATILAIVLAARGWLRVDKDARLRLPRIVLATLVMAAAILLTQGALTTWFDIAGSNLARVLLLTALVMTGLAVYLAALQALGVARLRQLMAAVRHGL